MKVLAGDFDKIDYRDGAFIAYTGRYRLFRKREKFCMCEVRDMRRYKNSDDGAMVTALIFIDGRHSIVLPADTQYDEMRTAFVATRGCKI